jgi:hypothetical protein
MFGGSLILIPGGEIVLLSAIGSIRAFMKQMESKSISHYVRSSRICSSTACRGGDVQPFPSHPILRTKTNIINCSGVISNTRAPQLVKENRFQELARRGNCDTTNFAMVTL